MAIQQHFQNWGNFYQVCVGVIFGIVSIWLWFRDRNKSVKIKELAEQTKILQELLNEFILPCLITYDRKLGAVIDDFKIKNSGGALFNLKVGKSINNNVIFTHFDPPVNLASNQDFRVYYKWNNSQTIDEVIFYFEDKMKRKYSQKLIFTGTKICFEPLIEDKESQ
jgi:hypothetical protein